VAIDDRRQRDGRPLEFLGTYDPKTEPERVVIHSEAVDAWLKKGAQLSPTVKSLMRRARRLQAAAGGAS
jgi:small subunit ribosomal protein S16